MAKLHPTGPARGPRPRRAARGPWDGTRASHVGSLAHRAIARVVEDPEGWRGGDGRGRAWRLAGSLLRGDAACARDWRARCLIAGGVMAYARNLLPPDAWRLLGVELGLGAAGRVDVAWRTGAGEVVYDEVKLATSAGRATQTGAWVRQAAGYAAHGARHHAAGFRGVRLVLLGAARASLLVAPDGSARPLPGTDLWFGAGGRAAGAGR